MAGWSLTDFTHYPQNKRQLWNETFLIPLFAQIFFCLLDKLKCKPWDTFIYVKVQSQTSPGLTNILQHDLSCSLNFGLNKPTGSKWAQTEPDGSQRVKRFLVLSVMRGTRVSRYKDTAELISSAELLWASEPSYWSDWNQTAAATVRTVSINPVSKIRSQSKQHLHAQTQHLCNYVCVNVRTSEDRRFLKNYCTFEANTDSDMERERMLKIEQIKLTSP